MSAVRVYCLGMGQAGQAGRVTFMFCAQSRTSAARLPESKADTNPPAVRHTRGARQITPAKCTACNTQRQRVCHLGDNQLLLRSLQDTQAKRTHCLAPNLACMVATWGAHLAGLAVPDLRAAAAVGQRAARHHFLAIAPLVVVVRPRVLLVQSTPASVLCRTRGRKQRSAQGNGIQSAQQRPACSRCLPLRAVLRGWPGCMLPRAAGRAAA